MARYRHYDPQQTKMIAVSYGRQLLPGSFEYALSYLIDNEIDLGRFAARFKNTETVAPAYFRQGGCWRLPTRMPGRCRRCWRTRSTTIRMPACSTRCTSNATQPRGHISIHRQRDAVTTGQTHPERT